MSRRFASALMLVKGLGGVEGRLKVDEIDSKKSPIIGLRGRHGGGRSDRRNRPARLRREK
jgi:hypothetical protein